MYQSCEHKTTKTNAYLYFQYILFVFITLQYLKVIVYIQVYQYYD